MLVHVLRGGTPPKGIHRPADSPWIEPISLATLRERLASAATWVRETSEGVADCQPPDWSVRAVHSRGQWEGIPRLEGIVEYPSGGTAGRNRPDSGLEYLITPTSFGLVGLCSLGAEVDHTDAS